jgi:hypothetical protein
MTNGGPEKGAESFTERMFAQHPLPNETVTTRRRRRASKITSEEYDAIVDAWMSAESERRREEGDSPL